MSFTVYKSSAGSGKTFTLVREYLRLVLADPRKFRRILAITFTNKAANEMKERILRSLLQIGGYPDRPLSGTAAVMFDQLAGSIGLPKEKLVENARLVTKLILHQYSDFAISTIDSFVHRVIRSFAFDLRIPMGFEVDMDTEETLRRIIDLLVNRAGSDPDLTDLLVRFTQNKAEEEKNWNIEEDIYQVAKLLMDEDSQAKVKELREYTLEDFMKINADLMKVQVEFEGWLKKKGVIAMGLFREAGVQPAALYQGKRGIFAWFERIAEGNFSSLKPNSYVLNTVEQDKWYSGKADTMDKDAIDAIKVRLSDLYLEIDRFLESNYERYLISKEIRKNIYPLAILHEIELMLNDYKTENNIVLISEFNQKIASVIASEPVPFIYERVGERYQHYLIDEFQDTSVLQWHNLIPLLENSLASEHFNMIVGDAKQAIYRWRSGEVEQFIRLPEVYKKAGSPFVAEREEVLKRNFDQRELKNNYRSAKLLVDFNNDFFESISGKLTDDYQKVYQHAGQVSGSFNQGGFAGIEFYDPDQENRSRDEYFFERTLEIIREVTKFQYRKRDIAILTRSNRNASSMAAFLLKHDIPVVSSESLLLSGSINVRTILSLARLILNPEDDISKVEIIHWLSHAGLTEDGLADSIRILIRKDRSQVQTTDFYSGLRKLGVEIHPSKLLKLNVYEFCEEVIRVLGMHKMDDPFLPFFLDAVLEQASDISFDLKSMIEWWERKKGSLSIIVPEEVDAVRIMTIHKSKGLEFPVVIYPFAGERLRLTRDKLWVVPKEQFPKLKVGLVDTSKRLEETIFEEVYQEEHEKSLLDLINLLYVVMTRAADRLYILSVKPPQKEGTLSVPGILRDYLMEADLWTDGQLDYAIGDPETRRQQNDRVEHEQPVAWSTDYSVDWRKLVSLSLQAPEYWDLDEPGKEQIWGNLLHKILSEIVDVDDVDRVIDHYFLQGVVDQEQTSLIKHQLQKFISHPAVRPYFSNRKSLKEIDILLPDGDVQRPDKIILEEGKVTIIDYKTGRKSQNHIHQVEKYKSTLKQMGYNQVDGVILYVYEPDPVVIV